MELKFFENRTEDQLVSEVHVTRAAVVVEMDGKVLYVKKRGKSTLELPLMFPETNFRLWRSDVCLRNS